MFRDSTTVTVVVVRRRPQAIPLAMIHMGKTIHGFPFVPLYGYGAPLGGRRSSTINFCNSDCHINLISNGGRYKPPTVIHDLASFTLTAKVSVPVEFSTSSPS